MKLALLALLAFAAPAPLPEAFSCAEEEVVLQASKSSLRQAPARVTARPATTVSVRPGARTLVEALPTRSLTEWTPSIFTRPPPLA
jgi:hypothetical protein